MKMLILKFKNKNKIKKKKFIQWLINFDHLIIEWTTTTTTTQIQSSSTSILNGAASVDANVIF